MNDDLNQGIAGLCCRTAEGSKHTLKKGGEHHNPDIDLGLTRSTIIHALPVLHNSKVSAVVQWTTLKKQRQRRIETEQDRTAANELVVLMHFFRVVDLFIERWWPYIIRKNTCWNQRAFRKVLLQRRRVRISTQEQGCIIVQRAWRARAHRIKNNEPSPYQSTNFLVDQSIDSPLYQYDEILAKKKVWWGG